MNERGGTYENVGESGRDEEVAEHRMQNMPRVEIENTGNDVDSKSSGDTCENWCERSREVDGDGRNTSRRDNFCDRLLQTN